MNVITPDWPAPASIKTLSTLRYPASDLILRPDQDHTLEQRLQLPTKPIWLKQTHSTHVIEAQHEHQGAEADASYTNQENHLCVVLTADCLPILLCNTRGTEVAAIHAGWRGLSHGIIENTVAKLDTTSHSWLAWLGPAIGPHYFEVGHDVYAAFTDHDASATQAFIEKSDGKWLANLYELAKQRLSSLGISRIYGGSYCTYSQAELFYSYRRDKGQTGRMASMIWISNT